MSRVRADADGAHQRRAIEVGHVHVVDGQSGLCVEDATRGRDRILARAMCACPRLERPRQRPGDGTFGGRQEHVARRQRQAVVIAHGGHGDDLERKVQVRHHAPDDGDLLRVLLAEPGGASAGRC